MAHFINNVDGSSSTRNVTLKRTYDGFGFNLSQRFPCYISDVRKGGEAHRVGLKIGDRIIAVQDVDVTKSCHAFIVDIIARSGAKLTLTVGEDGRNKMDSGSFMANERLELKIKNQIRYNNAANQEIFPDNNSLIRTKNYSTTGSSVLSSPNSSIVTATTNDDVEKFQKRAVAISRSLSEPSGIFAKPNLSLVKNKLNELKNSPSLVAEDRRTMENFLLKSVVAYIGAVPVTGNCPSRQRILRHALESLKAQKIRVRTVLLEVFTLGIVVTNSKGILMNRFHAENILFVIAYAKNKQFFAIATVHHSNKISNNNIETVTNSVDFPSESICHVFAVDPELHLHSFHENYAEKFKFKCTRDNTSNFCAEFPYVSTSIVYVINSYIVKPIQNTMKLLYSPEFCRTCQHYNSSNSDSGFGNGNNASKLRHRKNSFKEFLKNNYSKRDTKNLKVTFDSKPVNSSVVTTKADVHRDSSINSRKVSRKFVQIEPTNSTIVSKI